VKKVREQWWKYLIPQYFSAYKTEEIEQWPKDKILEFLAACQEFERQRKGGEN
jgi:hypothetical protein